MNIILDPVGFIADSIAIANALGFHTPAQQKQTEELHREIKATHEAVQDLGEIGHAHAEDIKNMISTAAVIEVRSRVEDVKAIPSYKLELLIKLLFCIKECAPNVIFAIVAKYKIRNTIATLGFAGSSSDAIEDVIRKVERLSRSATLVKQEKSVYINVRIRGKYDSNVENFCAAVLLAIATEVCDFSRSINLASVMECPLEAAGSKTTVLLQPAEYDDQTCCYDRLRRVFLVGDTRTGKSTVGNAILREGIFHVSRGMTGTMRIECGQRSEEIDNDIWLTEIYDTPGLNDKDGLDVLYETAIEDQIRILQRASTLIMTVGVDAGITQSAFKSLGSYKDLFGDSIASMLIVVLTVNEPANATDLQDHLNLNWPTISGLDSEIKERNVFCVSLHDLRTEEKTASHVVVEEIASACRGMPLKLIEALAVRYRRIKEALLTKSDHVEKRMRSLINEGWQTFDHLTEKYEQSGYVKMTDDSSGFMDGFVMKMTDQKRKALAAFSAGMINKIRKVAIHVHWRGKRSKKAWRKFFEAHASNRNDASLMRLLGDHLYDMGLAVMVRDFDVTHVGTLRVKRYKVTIFDPVSHTHEEWYGHFQDMISGKCDDMRMELITDLIRSFIPPAARYKRKGRGRERKNARRVEDRHDKPQGVVGKLRPSTT